MDGSLIPIDAPTENEAAYVDRHGDHSINTMMVCGPNMEFFYVSARWPDLFMIPVYCGTVPWLESGKMDGTPFQMQYFLVTVAMD